MTNIPYLLLTYPKDPLLRDVSDIVYSTQAFWIVTSDENGVLSSINKNIYIRHYLKRNISFLRDLDSFDYELRYFNKNTDAKAHEVRLCLLVETWAQKSLNEDIIILSEKASRHLRETFCKYFSEYKLIPVETKSELEEIIRPFELKHVCSIDRRHAVARVDDPTKPLFINHKEKNIKGWEKLPLNEIDLARSDEYFYFVCPFIIENNNLKDPINIIRYSNQNLMISIRISKALFLKNKIYRPANLAYNIFRRFQKNNRDKDKRISDVSKLIRNYRKLLGSREDEIVIMRIIIASDKKINIDTARKIANQISIPVRRIMFAGGYDLNMFNLEPSSFMEKDLHFDSLKGERMITCCGGWRNIFTADEAICAFRIPISLNLEKNIVK